MNQTPATAPEPALLDLPAMELAARVRAGSLSPVDLVEAHIARMEAVNPALNALVADRYDRAREEAKAARARVDEARSGGGAELPPLLGLPFTIKEFFPVEGLPHTCGNSYRTDLRATIDAAVVTRLREAGAICLGVTNVPEGGLWLETYNTVWGRTSNPWDLRHTPGGSSGGEGAVVAAGAVAFGIGADIGGSIRLPAAFCGVVGHKPTPGLVPNTGHWPVSAGPAARMLSTGPLTRRVSDVMPLLRILAGPDGVDPDLEDVMLPDPGAVSLEGLPVLVPPDEVLRKVRADVRIAVHRAAAALESRGAEVRTLSVPVLGRAVALWTAALTAWQGESFDRILTAGAGMSLTKEAFLALGGCQRHILPVHAVVLLERLVRLLPERTFGRGRDDAEALRLRIEEDLGGGVLLYPPYSTTAPRHGAARWRPFDFGWTALWSALRLPVTSVPTGFDARGLPLAVQVVGARFRDHVTLAAAGAIESAFGGWIRAEPGTARSSANGRGKGPREAPLAVSAG